jgi:hypothetical protein
MKRRALLAAAGGGALYWGGTKLQSTRGRPPLGIAELYVTNGGPPVDVALEVEKAGDVVYECDRRVRSSEGPVLDGDWLGDRVEYGVRARAHDRTMSVSTAELGEGADSLSEKGCLEVVVAVHDPPGIFARRVDCEYRDDAPTTHAYAANSSPRSRK